MDLAKVEGLKELLGSISLTEQTGGVFETVFPWHEYSRVPEEDIGFWYTPQRCQYSTVRKIVGQALKKNGHVVTDRVSGCILLTFALLPKADDLLERFEALLSAFVPSDVSQFLFIPASPLLKNVEAGEEPKYDIIGLFGHHEFTYEPAGKEFIRILKNRFRTNGLGKLADSVDAFSGSLCLHREPRGTQVLDFDRLGFRGVQPSIVTKLMGYYFDDVAAALFEEFWKEHLESQYIAVAGGAKLLSRGDLESLPGTGWLSIFIGFKILSARGMISLITEESHHRDRLSLAVYLFGKELTITKGRLDREVFQYLGEPPHRYFDSLQHFARLVARSRELEDNGYVDESFALLMVAIESLLAEKESISATVSRRTAALIAISDEKEFDKSQDLVSKLYNARSKFVHEGQAISTESLNQLKDVCRIVFFAVFRSQSLWPEPEQGDWHVQWINAIDYLSACLKAGVPVESSVATRSGALRPGAAPADAHIS